MKRRFGFLAAMITTMALVFGAVGVMSVGATKKGSEGCTPGYWKQSQHFDSWTSPYDWNDQFSAFFDNAFPGKSLLTVLTQPGSSNLSGGTEALNALGRHTVAALLNGASGGVDYPYSAASVVTSFNNAYPGTDAQYLALKNMFAGFNELGCPLN